MDDKYDSPHGEQQEGSNYEPDPIDSAGEMGGSAIEIVKGNWKKILIAIVLLGALLFAYNFFIGSIKQVTFNVTDTEGKSLNANIKVLSEAGQEIARLRSSETAGIREGSYLVDIQSDGYKPIRATPITVTDSSRQIEQELELDKDIELSGSFPANFATGELKELEIRIINNETSNTEIELALDDDAKSAMTIEYAKPLNLRTGENQLSLKLKVKENPSKSEIGSAKNGAIRVVGLSAKKSRIEGKYSLVQFNIKNIRLTVGSSSERLDYGSVKAGEHVEKALKIKNDNDFKVDDIAIELTITETEFGDKAEIKKWFKFSPENTISTGAKSEETITLITEIPLGFKFPEGKESVTVNGVISAATSFFTKNIDFRLVAAKPKTAVNVSGIQDIITLSKSAEGYTKISNFLDIKNNGDVLLRDFAVRVDCASLGTSWLTLENNSLEYTFDSLEKGMTKSVPYVIAVPPATPQGQIVNCKIGVLYKEPSGSRPTVLVPVIIKT